MIDLPPLLPVVVRYLGFVSLTMLIGSFAFVCLILPPGLLSREGYRILERHLRQVQAGSILITALASGADLILRTLAMSGGVSALSVALPLVLWHTHFGMVWNVRFLLLGLLTAAWRIRLPGITASPLFAWASFMSACFVALTTTLSGHAADWGDLSIPAMVDWLHLLAVSIWIGGLFTFSFLLKRSLAMAGMEEIARALSPIGRLFSRIAIGCVAVFLLTGLYNSRLQVGALSFVVASVYGWILLTKLALVALALTIAAINRFYLLTQLRPGAARRIQLGFQASRDLINSPQAAGETGDDRQVRYRLSQFVRAEWIVVMIVLACSALLTQLPPARHVMHIKHLKSHENNGSHPPAHDMSMSMPPLTQR